MFLVNLGGVLFFLTLCFLPVAIFGYDGIIQGSEGALFFIQEVIRKVCIISGIGTILCSFMRYIAYRKKTSYVKIGQPIWLFVIGACLIMLAYLPSPLDHV
jgi:hypothetical protein